jgi:hypothetical protein
VDRLTPGMTTTWFLNLRDLFFDTGNGGAVGVDAAELESPQSAATARSFRDASSQIVPISPSRPGVVHLVDSATGNYTSVVSTSIAAAARFQPVRLIRLQLHVSRQDFALASDSLFIYEGDPSLTGTRVLALLGTDQLPDPLPYPPPPGTPDSELDITQTAAYWNRYGTQLRSLVNRTTMSVLIRSNAASLRFTSRDTAGHHFFATYEFMFDCSPYSLYFLDPASNSCQSQLPQYIVSPGIRDAVYAVSSLALLWIAVQMVFLAWSEQSASARPIVHP